MQIEHELAQAPLQPGERPFQHHEARPRDCGGKIEVHEPEPFADIEMLLRREGKLAYGPMFADLAIGAFVAALGYFIERNIGNFREHSVELLAKPAFAAPRIPGSCLELLNLSFSRSAVALSFWAIALPISFDAALRLLCAS